MPPEASGTGGSGTWQPGREDHCYRHRDRQSFVLCQRCGRTVCGECQTPGPVGVICPDCMKADRKSAPRSRPGASIGTRFAGTTATMAIIAVTAVVSLAQLLLSFATGRDPIGQALEFAGIYTHLDGGRVEPWRELTYALVHGSFLHLAFNLITLWFFGRAVEAAVGRGRLALLYVVSVLGGAAAVALLAPTSAVIGASGGVFGLMAAAFFVLRETRSSTRTLLVLIAANLVFGFVVSGVSWQAHLGGLLAGAAAGWLLLRDARTGPRTGSGARAFGPSSIPVWALGAALILVPFAVTAIYRVSPGF